MTMRITFRGRLLRAVTATVLVVATGSGTAADTRRWAVPAADALHDPDNPGTRALQPPGDALSRLPPNGAGNQVDWVRALRDGLIAPRTKLESTTHVQTLDRDILMRRTVEMPYVRFPHLAHSEWLDCSNCHEKLFRMKAGTTPVSMLAILQGEYCGRCHGAVAFPLTECNRCHSVPRNAKGAP